ncbi:MAG: adenylosuccinate lyase [Bacteroidetes bacterium]|nr:adenylosuccinate lyase [Bacteroidota bacterium]
MDLSQLSAISPVDGRYRKVTSKLAPFFSEYGLVEYRIKVEVNYLIALAELPIPNVDFTTLLQKKNLLLNWAENPGETTIENVKNIEKTTNHDVKAVEYVVKEKLDSEGLGAFREWVHFGLTSQDINNTAIPWSCKDALQQVIYPQLQHIIDRLRGFAAEWSGISMLARTHGQPASPTRLGKEIMVFVVRLENQVEQLKQIPFSAKFGGATGNFNAHHVAFPQIHWENFGTAFVNQRLGLNRSAITTQIEHYDNLAALCDAFKRINNILIDFSRDIWSYISMEYFKQKIKEGEVGSSAMPHKVNPIDFENAEGNLGVANAIFEHLAAKLPISRLQRDLTDSTVLRNIGVPFAHALIAYNSLLKGMEKLLLNKDAIDRDLENNWAVVAEAIQTVLRRENYPNPYEALKELTRKNEKISRESLAAFIQDLQVSAEIKSELLAITPFTYTGIVSASE